MTECLVLHQSSTASLISPGSSGQGEHTWARFSWRSPEKDGWSTFASNETAVLTFKRRDSSLKGKKGQGTWTSRFSNSYIPKQMALWKVRSHLSTRTSRKRQKAKFSKYTQSICSGTRHCVLDRQLWTRLTTAIPALKEEFNENLTWIIKLTSRRKNDLNRSFSYKK